jgi:LmeA-like phospholipid-binding
VAAFFVVLFILIALALAVALADRVLMTLAERKASDFVSEPFGHAPLVRVHGTPFLTQVLKGRYRQIEVSGGGLQVGDISGATLDARLYNALLPPLELLTGRTRQLPCERVEGRILLPYGEVARVSRVPALSLSYRKSKLIASASLPVPGLDQIVRVSGAAELSVVDGTVWLRVRGLSVAGFSILPSVLVKQLLPILNVPIPLSRLPYGLRLKDLKPVPAGIEVYGSAEDVVLIHPR